MLALAATLLSLTAPAPAGLPAAWAAADSDTCGDAALCELPVPAEPVERATPAVIDCSAPVAPALESLVGECDQSWRTSHESEPAAPHAALATAPARRPACDGATACGDGGDAKAPPPPSGGARLAAVLTALPMLAAPASRRLGASDDEPTHHAVIDRILRPPRA